MGSRQGAMRRLSSFAPRGRSRIANCAALVMDFAAMKSLARRTLAGPLLAVACASLSACGSKEPPSAGVSVPAGAAASPQTHQPEAGGAAATVEPRAPQPPAQAPLTEQEPRVPVLEQQVAYGEAAKRNLVGYLAMPRDAAEPLPGIIVIHDWWGLNDDIKAMTRLLAGEGYIALAVDLFGGTVASTPDQAQALMASITGEPDTVRANLEQAYNYLEKYALAPRIGSIGWALGGGWSLQAALLLPDKLHATVMYYGPVVTDEERLRVLDTPLLGFFGGLDKTVPVNGVQEFRAKLQQLGKNADILIYAGVDRAFADPSGGHYDQHAVADSWERTLSFFRANLKNAGGAAR